jgi:hypothetical protein
VTGDLRMRIARALADHAQADLALDAHHYGPEKWLCCADAVLAALPDSPDDLDQLIREQAAADPRFATGYIEAQYSARLRALDDLLAAVWLFIDWRHVTERLTAEQRTLFADAVEASSARIAQADPTYGEPVMTDRWWQP